MYTTGSYYELLHVVHVCITMASTIGTPPPIFRPIYSFSSEWYSSVLSLATTNRSLRLLSFTSVSQITNVTPLIAAQTVQLVSVARTTESHAGTCKQEGVQTAAAEIAAHRTPRNVRLPGLERCFARERGCCFQRRGCTNPRRGG